MDEAYPHAEHALVMALLDQLASSGEDFSVLWLSDEDE